MESNSEIEHLYNVINKQRKQCEELQESLDLKDFQIKQLNNKLRQMVAKSIGTDLDRKPFHYDTPTQDLSRLKNYSNKTIFLKTQEDADRLNIVFKSNVKQVERPTTKKTGPDEDILSYAAVENTDFYVYEDEEKKEEEDMPLTPPVLVRQNAFENKEELTLENLLKKKKVELILICKTHKFKGYSSCTTKKTLVDYILERI